MSGDGGAYQELRGEGGGEGGDLFADGPLTWVPDYCVADEVRECMLGQHREKPGSTAPMMCVCGPILPWMHAASALLWLFFLLFPLYAANFTYCYPDTVFAKSNTLVVWLPFLPLLAATSWIEQRCLSYVIGIYVQVRQGSITLLGFNFVDSDFTVWRLWMFAQSTISHLSIVSNSLLMVRCWKTEFGGCDQRLVDLWAYVIGSSPFHLFLPRHLVAWAAGLWCLMLLQPIVGLLRTYPIGPPVSMEDEDLNAHMAQANGGGGSFVATLRRELTPSRLLHAFKVDYKAEVSRERVYEYMTLLSLRQNHATAAYVLGCVTRMASITSPNWGYEMARIEMHNQGQVASRNDANRVLNHLFDSISNKLSDFWLVGILENLFSLHVQISLLALQRAVRPKGALLSESDLQTLFGIVVNMGSLAARTTSVFDMIKIRRLFKRTIDELEASPHGLSQFASTRKQHMEHCFVIFNATVVVYVLLLLWAAVKVAALFVCNSGLVNLGGGCVE